MNLERAIQIAAEAHAGQIDKANEPYILHPLRVMFGVSGEEAKIVAVLHDVVEDCEGWNFERLEREGFSQKIIQALKAVSKRPEEENDYMAFIKRSGQNEIGRELKPLTKYVNGLRQRLDPNVSGNVVVPYFDPLDGGADASLLFLLEKPGPGAAASEFISRDNDDPTAANVFSFMNEAAIPRRATVLWNAIPSWNGTTDFDEAEIEAALPHLNDLIMKLRRLERIVFVGKTASSVRFYVLGKWPKIQCFRSPHPSRQNTNTRPDMSRKIVEAWRLAGANLTPG